MALLAALSYALLGRSRRSLHCWHRQAAAWDQSWPPAPACRAALGPWPASGPARAVATAALRDDAWAAAARTTLDAADARLVELLAPRGKSQGATPFRSLPRHDAARLHAGFAAAGILLRCFAEPAGLRVGLPGNEMEWRRLAAAVENLA